MTYEDYANQQMPLLADLPDDEPQGLCSRCGMLCRFTQDPYTGRDTSTCCGALPARPRLLR